MYRVGEEDLGKISDDEDIEGDAGAGGSEMLEGAADLALDSQDKGAWPSVADLNTRLRRVISSYQRNFKREEMKLAQKAKVQCVVKFLLTVYSNPVHCYSRLNAVRKLSKWFERENVIDWKFTNAAGLVEKKQISSELYLLLV